jgi:CRP-like cAMP-binding protein
MEPLIRHIQQQLALTPHQAEVIMAHFTRLKKPKKTLLLKEGTYCKDLFFVEKGCLRLYFIDEKGREQITHFAIENWWLTDYLAFDTKGIAAFNIQTVEDSVIFQIDHANLAALTEALPIMDRYFRLNLQRAFGAAQRRIMMMYEKSKEAYFHEFNEKHPEFVQRVPQYMLASFLGFTPEYLSELRKKIK